MNPVRTLNFESVERSLRKGSQQAEERAQLPPSLRSIVAWKKERPSTSCLNARRKHLHPSRCIMMVSTLKGLQKCVPLPRCARNQERKPPMRRLRAFLATWVWLPHQSPMM